jgi:hypothetical protein
VLIEKKRIRKGEIGRDFVDQGNNVMLLTESNTGDEVSACPQQVTVPQIVASQQRDVLKKYRTNNLPIN